jgi:hypothetical protein
MLAAALALLWAATSAGAAMAESQEEPTFSCSGVTFSYSGFPNLPNNTTKEKVRVDGVVPPWKTFTFDGESGSDFWPLTLSPGHHSLDAWAKWNTNGVIGGHDKSLKGGIVCGAEPRFSIEKLQEVEGGQGSGGFTSAPLSAEIGKTVRYEILARNTGNVPLRFGKLSDERCDPETITEGPGEAEVAPGAMAVYFCQHVITLADLGGSTYSNTVTTTAAQAGEESSSVSSSSNTVVVNVLPKEEPKEEPKEKPKEEPKGKEEQKGNEVSTTSTVAQGGVLGVKTSSLTPPVFGQSANLLRVSGTVLIKTPGSAKFIPISAGTSVPLGTIIDATNGVAELVTAADVSSHTTETGLFYAGVFRLGQIAVHTRAGSVAMTVLTLVGQLPKCAKAHHRGRKASVGALASRKRSTSRKLWGNAKGNFRTVGRYAAATVRGTKWLTEDVCAGTLVRVARHLVSVEDFPHHRSFTLRAPRHFLVHPGRGG